MIVLLGGPYDGSEVEPAAGDEFIWINGKACKAIYQIDWPRFQAYFIRTEKLR